MSAAAGCGDPHKAAQTPLTVLSADFERLEATRGVLDDRVLDLLADNRKEAFELASFRRPAPGPELTRSFCARQRKP